MEKTTKEEKDVNVNTKPLISFSLLEDDLVSAAATFKNEHSRLVVLVLDSVDRLAIGAPELLAFFQDFAKNR